MKTNTIQALLILVALIVLGCKYDTSTTTESLIVPDGLVFNDGAKWIVNSETHIGMKRIDYILKTNTSTGGTVLRDALSKETSYIIKSCDMKGIAHDQLHVVLVPILEQITDIKDIKEPHKLAEGISNLKSLVNVYFKYFIN